MTSIVNSLAGTPSRGRGDMQQERVLEILRRRPETVVDGAAIGLVRPRRDRNEGADQAHLDAALELFRGRIGVVDIEHGDALEPARMRLAEIGDPVVVDAAYLGQQLAVRNTVPKQALARLQHRAPDPVLLVFAIIASAS